MKGKAGFWVPHLGAAFFGILDTYPNAGIALGVEGFAMPIQAVVCG